MFVGIILQQLVEIVVAEAVELAEGVSEDVVIVTRDTQLAEAAQAHSAAYVLGRGDGFEIVDVVIERIAVVMVNLMAGRYYSFPCPIHGFVTIDVAERL